MVPPVTSCASPNPVTPTAVRRSSNRRVPRRSYIESSSEDEEPSPKRTKTEDLAYRDHKHSQQPAPGPIVSATATTDTPSASTPVRPLTPVRRHSQHAATPQPTAAISPPFVESDVRWEIVPLAATAPQRAAKTSATPAPTTPTPATTQQSKIHPGIPPLPRHNVRFNLDPQGPSPRTPSASPIAPALRPRAAEAAGLCLYTLAHWELSRIYCRRITSGTSNAANQSAKSCKPAGIRCQPLSFSNFTPWTSYTVAFAGCRALLKHSRSSSYVTSYSPHPCLS